MSNPDLQNGDDPANPEVADFLPPWKEWVDQYTKFFSYIRTRRAIRNGHPLWNYSRTQLKNERLLEPWPFDIYQSVLAALPSVLLVKLYAFMGILSDDERDLLESLGPDRSHYMLALANYSETLLIPLSLALICFGVAWGTVRAQDRSKDTLARARRAYLYFDGTYGLWPQGLAALGLVMVSYKESVLWVVLPAVLAGIYWQVVLTTWKIPKALFAVNGYALEYPRTWFWFRRDANSKAWRRYKLFMFFGTGVALKLLRYGFAMLVVILSIGVEAVHVYLTTKFM